MSEEFESPPSEADSEQEAGKIQRRSTLASFAFYLLVAPASMVADLSVYWSLISVSDGLDPVLAHLVSRPVGGLVCFFLNKHVTFLNMGRTSAARQMAKFWVVFGASYLLSTGLLALFVRVLNMDDLPAKLTAEATCVLFNYLSLRFWTFR